MTVNATQSAPVAAPHAAEAVDWRYRVNVPPSADGAPMSQRAEQISRQRPFGWELLLLAQLIDDEIARFADARRRAFAAQRSATGEQVPDPTVIAWLTTRIQEMSDLIDALSDGSLTRDIDVAMGPPGEPGDPERLVAVGRRIGDGYAEALTWKLRIRGADLPSRWRPVQQALAAFADAPISQLVGFSERLRRAHSQAGQASGRQAGSPTAPISLTLTFAVPQDVEREYRDALQRAVAGA